MALDFVTVAVPATLLAAAAARSALGFGDALVAMPLLVLFVGVRTATPLAALLGMTMTGLILARSWRGVDLKAAWRLVLATLAGIPFGLFLLTRAPAPVVKAILGAVLIAFGLYNLIGPRLGELRSERSSYLFGFAAGVLGGAYNTNGPPVVAYGMLRRWPPETFRATFSGYCLPSGVAVLVAHAAAGLWTAEVIHGYLWGLPAILVGFLLGDLFHRRARAAHFQFAANAFLVLMGVLLLF